VEAKYKISRWFVSLARWLYLIIAFLGIDSRDGITVSEGDILELSGSKGEANFIIKWSSSSSQSYIKIVNAKGVSGLYTAENSGKYVTILVLECRGIIGCNHDIEIYIECL